MPFSVNYVAKIGFFLAFLGLMMLIVPPEYRFMNIFDFAWLTGGILGVGGACAIATGIPCAAALAVFGIVGFFNYMVINVNWIKILIFTPIALIMIYLITRIARGGG